MKRLKIVEQIIIVIIISVFIPSVIIGIIINNISQQSIRRELNYSANFLAKVVGEELNYYFESAGLELNQITNTLKYINENKQKAFLNDVVQKNSKFKNFKIKNKNKVISKTLFNYENSTLEISESLNNEEYLTAEVDINKIREILKEKLQNEKRVVYLLDSDRTLIATNDTNPKELDGILKNLPKKNTNGEAELFGNLKNQPMAYYTLNNPKWVVVVNTTEKITKNTINLARYRILLAISLSGLFIIFIIGLYTYYLYINIRQLFKGIIAISKGSYDRKIYLIKNIFTPYEIVFLAKEFNYMAKKVAQSHLELYEKNVELQRLDGFRSNLVSATSHEFRTPLTNIVGYTSRLLRSDIEIDEDTRKKSLKIIKQQAQRLSRMVEDLLIVPDIESYRLKLNLDFENLEDLIETSIFYVNSLNNKFDVQLSPDLKPVYVDRDKLTQIFVNLLDNAIKYKKDDSEIKIRGFVENNKNVVIISNKSNKIDEKHLNKLFDKFVRLEDTSMKTTIGTGLGLFIVKGIADTMNIDVMLKSDEEYFSVILTFLDNEPKIQDEENDIED